MAQTCILRIFQNPLLPHLLFDVNRFFFLSIFNPSSGHIVLCKMINFYTNKTSSSGVSSPHVMFHIMFSNVLKFSIVVASTPCVVIPTKYSFQNLLYWVQYLGFAFRRFVTIWLHLWHLPSNLGFSLHSLSL